MFQPLCRVRYCSVRAMTSSTGARRCEACSNRRSIKPSNPSASYLNKYRRKLRSHIPNIRAASNCVSRPAFQPSYVSSNLILRFSCSTSVRLIWHPLRSTMTTGQMSRYRTGQIMNSQHSRFSFSQRTAANGRIAFRMGGLVVLGIIRFENRVSMDQKNQQT